MKDVLTKEELRFLLNPKDSFSTGDADEGADAREGMPAAEASTGFSAEGGSRSALADAAPGSPVSSLRTSRRQGSAVRRSAPESSGDAATIFHLRLCAELAHEMAANIGTAVRVTPGQTRSVPGAVQDHGVVRTRIEIAPVAGEAYLSLDARIAEACLRAALGGADRSPADSSRPLTKLDRKILADALKGLSGCLRRALMPRATYPSLRPDTLPPDTSQPLTELTCLTEAAGVRGAMTFCYPTELVRRDPGVRRQDGSAQA